MYFYSFNCHTLKYMYTTKDMQRKNFDFALMCSTCGNEGHTAMECPDEVFTNNIQKQEFSNTAITRQYVLKEKIELRKCPCRDEYYCSIKCQNERWKKTHSLECKWIHPFHSEMIIEEKAIQMSLTTSNGTKETKTSSPSKKKTSKKTKPPKIKKIKDNKESELAFRQNNCKGNGQCFKQTGESSYDSGCGKCTIKSCPTCAQKVPQYLLECNKGECMNCCPTSSEDEETKSTSEQPDSIDLIDDVMNSIFEREANPKTTVDSKDEDKCDDDDSRAIRRRVKEMIAEGLDDSDSSDSEHEKDMPELVDGVSSNDSSSSESSDEDEEDPSVDDDVKFAIPHPLLETNETEPEPELDSVAINTDTKESKN